MTNTPQSASTLTAKLPPALAGVLLLAFGLRLAAVLWLSETVPHSDYGYYQMAAEKIVEDWGFFFDSSQVEYYARFGWWPPLYPFTLASLYSVFGVNHRIAVFAQVALGTLACWLVYRIVRRCGGERAGLFAALLVAINPTYIFATNLLASENLFVVWLTLGLLWATRKPSTRGTLVAAGIFLGLGALTRAIGVFVPFVVAAWLAPGAESRRAWLKNAATLLIACFAIIAPWTLRNAVVVGSPAIVCFGGGLNFYFGHNEVGIGYRDLENTPMGRLTTQVAIDRIGYELGFRYIAAHPLAFATGAGRKTIALFKSPGYAPHSNSAILLPDGWRTDPVKRRIAEEMRQRQRQKNRLLDGLFTRLAELHSYFILAAALVAVFLWRRRLPPELWLMTWLSIGWIGAHVLFWAQPRFRYPMELYLMSLAGFALASWRGTRSRTADGAVPSRSQSRGRARRGRSGGGTAMWCLALLGVPLACALGSCAPTAKRPLPPLEAWGDLAQPYGDALDAAARAALGRRDPEYAVRRTDAISLEDFYTLDMVLRQAREGRARNLRAQATTLRTVSGVDSLGLYLEALHVAPVDVPSYEEAGRILLERGAWRRSHALIVQGIRLDPRNGVLWALLGAAYFQVGDSSKARAAFEYALTQGDRDTQRTNVAETLAMLYVQEGEYARADSLILAAAGATPAWLRSYANGKEALARGDSDLAHEKLLEATSDPGAQSAVHADLGTLERDRGDLDAAETAYRRALDLDPHQQAARIGLGVVQWARGDLDQAMLRFARLVQVNPDDHVAQFNYGGVLLDAAGESDDPSVADSLYAQAAQCFGVCIDANFQRASAYAGRAQAHLRRGDLDAALTDARQLSNSPEHAEQARLLIARASLSAGNPGEVVHQLEPLYEDGSLSRVGLAMLGKAFLDQERYERSAAVLLRAIEKGSSSLSVEMNYAVALSESGKHLEAEAVLRGLIDEHPNNPNLLQNLAAVLQRQGRIVEADRLLIQVNHLEGR